MNGVVTQSCNGDQRVSLSGNVTCHTCHVSRVLTPGSGTTCSLTINGAVSLEDAGSYKCVLADSGDMQTTSRTIQTAVSW